MSSLITDSDWCIIVCLFVQGHMQRSYVDIPPCAGDTLPAQIIAMIGGATATIMIFKVQKVFRKPTIKDQIIALIGATATIMTFKVQKVLRNQPLQIR